VQTALQLKSFILQSEITNPELASMKVQNPCKGPEQDDGHNFDLRIHIPDTHWKSGDVPHEEFPWQDWPK
jgi:hypothetical protein